MSNIKRISLPSRLLQLRLRLLQQQQGASSSRASDPSSTSRSSASSTSRFSCANLFPTYLDPYAPDEPDPPQQQQEPQQQLQQRWREQVSVFVVSAQTGSGVKQLWQHVLKEAAAEPLVGAPAAATEGPSAEGKGGMGEAAAFNSKRRTAKRGVFSPANPAEMPDEFL